LDITFLLILLFKIIEAKQFRPVGGAFADNWLTGPDTALETEIFSSEF
jgi:hypothetical protein